MAKSTKLKRVMKRAGELRADGKDPSKALKTAWKEEKGGKSTTKKSTAKKSTAKKAPAKEAAPKKKFSWFKK